MSSEPLPTRWAEEGEEPNPDTDLVLWVLHNRLTSDHPGFYVMRREWVGPGGRVVCRQALLHVDKEPLLRQLPPDLVCRPHQPGEDFTIEETWL